MSKSATSVSANSTKVCARRRSVGIGLLSAVLRPTGCCHLGGCLLDNHGVGAKAQETVADDRARGTKVETQQGSRAFVEVHVLDPAQCRSHLAENELPDWLEPFGRGALLRLSGGRPENLGTGDGHRIGPECLQIAPGKKGAIASYLR